MLSAVRGHNLIWGINFPHTSVIHINKLLGSPFVSFFLQWETSNALQALTLVYFAIFSACSTLLEIFLGKNKYFHHVLVPFTNSCGRCWNWFHCIVPVRNVPFSKKWEAVAYVEKQIVCKKTMTYIKKWPHFHQSTNHIVSCTLLHVTN